MTGFERFRRKALMSRSQLADYLGMTVQAVRLWETGEAVPTTKRLVQLSEMYGVTMEALLRSDYPDNDISVSRSEVEQ